MIEEISRKTIPFKNAFIWIFLCTVMVSGSVILSYLYYHYSLDKRMHDPAYTITTIEYSISNKKSLSTKFLAETLGLSVDKPLNIYRFSINEGVQKLMQTSLISRCQIKKKMPSTLLIDYQVRTPIAYMSDYEDTLIDGTGVIFPCTPFFPSLPLPKIYFGEEALNQKESDAHLNLAFSALEFIFQQKEIKLIEVDLSNAFASSYGRREIVFIVEDTATHATHILRCNTRTYQKEIAYYQKIKSQIVAGDTQTIIDLRIPKLAFVK